MFTHRPTHHNQPVAPPRFAFILNRGQLTRFKPVSQVGAIDLERIANLAGASLGHAREGIRVGAVRAAMDRFPLNRRGIGGILYSTRGVLYVTRDFPTGDQKAFSANL